MTNSTQSDPPHIGAVGLWSSAPALRSASVVRRGVADIEELGFGALWYPEMTGGRECFSVAGLLLAASESIVIASGIASIYARDPTAASNGIRTLADSYPERFLLGLGVSHQPSVDRRGHNYQPPLQAMRTYLDDMTAAAYTGDEPDRPSRVVLAALGPRMLSLAAERAHGALTYFVPAEHTTLARARLGPSRLLAVEQAIVFETDSETARAIARQHTNHYLALENYRRNLLRLGWGADELENGGSDDLVDALVAWGDPEAIAARVQAQFDAGADHVCIQPLPAGCLHIKQLRTIAPSLGELQR